MNVLVVRFGKDRQNIPKIFLHSQMQDENKKNQCYSWKITPKIQKTTVYKIKHEYIILHQ